MPSGVRGTVIDAPLADGRLRSERCLVMGILNATPDSFSDGGALTTIDDLHARLDAMAGADILDVGGESTRPGHAPVTADEQWRRVQPVIETIQSRDQAVPISIDTASAVVAERAIQAGASFVNDVSGLGDPDMGGVVRDAGCAVVLMRHAPLVGDAVTACKGQLQELVARARTAGIPDESIIVDPGLGFGARPGSSVADNLALLDAAGGYGFPALIGASRKRFVGAWAGIDDVRKRGPASVALAVRARDAGAAVVRVHDVAETVAALQCV